MANPTPGELRPNAKLTAAKVARARELYRQGWSAAALAQLYGVTESPMYDAITGKYWRHVPDPVPKGFRPKFWRQKATSR